MPSYTDAGPDRSVGQCDRSRKAVDLLGIIAKNRTAFGLTHGDLNGEARVIVVPMRIVARIDDTVQADPIEDGAQVMRVLRFFDRLRRVPEIAAQVLRRLELEAGNLAPHLCNVGVEPPTEARNPGEATLNQNDLQAWIAVEHAFQDQAGGLCRHRVA